MSFIELKLVQTAAVSKATSRPNGTFKGMVVIATPLKIRESITRGVSLPG